MKQDVNEDGTTPGEFGVNRRSVLKAVGATAVVGGVFPGMVAAENSATWGGQGSENDEEGCSAFKFVLAPAGSRDPALGVAVLSNGGTVVDTKSRDGPGAIVFDPIDGPLGDVTATYSGGNPGAKLVLSSSECDGDGECKPCDGVGTSKFNWNGSAFVSDGANPLGITMSGDAQNATFESTEGYCVTATVCGGPGQGQGGQDESCLEQVVRCVTQGDGSTSGTLTGIPKPDCWSGDQATPFDISNVTFTCV